MAISNNACIIMMSCPPEGSRGFKDKTTTSRIVGTHTSMATPYMSYRRPQPRRWHAAFGVGFKHFIWGGYGSDVEIPTTQIETFDISCAKWEFKTQELQGSLPDRLWSMAVTTDEENVYSFGGHTSSGRINTIYQINPYTLECSELRPARSTPYEPKGTTGSRIVCFKDKLLVYGGETDQGYMDDLHVFDLRKSDCGNNKF